MPFEIMNREPIICMDKLIKYVPPVNRCIGCRNRLELTGGIDKAVANPLGLLMIYCVCVPCSKCGALYNYGLFGSKSYGGPCDCGNCEPNALAYLS